jgi:UDP-N-acetyl-D-galactosamine dehydrogenase
VQNSSTYPPKSIIQSIVIIGLGYVGLPLAMSLSKKFNVIGFDIDYERIEDLKEGHDKTDQFDSSELLESSLIFTSNSDLIADKEFYIVTVPTPVDENNLPDLRLLKSACATFAGQMGKNSTVIIESTVYPGTTEEICVPLIEVHSGNQKCKDFHFGYSPERINPGDKVNTLENVVKVISACCPATLEKLKTIYGSVTAAGLYCASNIKVAESAKIIENTQRDLNIALINELSIIFDLLGVDTLEVIEAASSKWNFHKFTPGLVGGHCIGVDPYYLTFKAQELGYDPKVILSGRELNDSMPRHVTRKFVRELEKKGLNPSKSKCLVLGLTFKENCPDIRNSGALKLIQNMIDHGIDVSVWDPWVLEKDLKNWLTAHYVQPKDFDRSDFDSVILAVQHDKFHELEGWVEETKFKGVVFDLKGFFPKEIVDVRL